MPIPTVNLDFCSEPVDLHCPVCGQAIFTLGGPQVSCHHLIFLGDSASGRWSWQQNHDNQAFNRVLQQGHENACKNGFYGARDDYVATIKADKAAGIAVDVISRKSAFMFSISTSDIGCGGMHNGTIHAIFDYLPEQQNSICNRPCLE